jgi:hypothetical protein
VIHTGALWLADSLAAGRQRLVDTPNRLRLAYEEVGLRPVFVFTGRWGFPHVFQYRCTINGQVGVATHIKIATRPFSDARAFPAEHHARYCSPVNQRGIVAVGQSMEREYHCRLHFLSSERERARQTARILLANDDGLRAQARGRVARVCLLPSSDIQCAPCDTSDRLVARYESVRRGASCPAGSLSWIE